MAKKTSEKTSKKVASQAAKLLQNPDTPADVKSVAASALTQAEDKPDRREKLQLFVGVNFRADGDEEETRVEPGIIDLGVLPAAFENLLIEKGKARIRLN